MFFGIAYVFIPLGVLIAVEIVIVGYALLVSLLAVIGMGVDGVTGRRRGTA